MANQFGKDDIENVPTSQLEDYLKEFRDLDEKSNIQYLLAERYLAKTIACERDISACDFIDALIDQQKFPTKQEGNFMIA